MDSIILLIIIVLIMVVFVVPITLFRAVDRISKLERRLTNVQNELANIRVNLLEKRAKTVSKKEIPTEAPPETIITQEPLTTATVEIVKEKEPQIKPALTETFPFSNSANSNSSTKSTPYNHSSDKTYSVKPEPYNKTVFSKATTKLIANIQENWLVWVGGLAMLIGGGYLVKEISNHIEFSPLMRITIALLSSFIIVALGEWFHHKEQKTPEYSQRVQGFTYIPAAITATGLTGIYCTTIFAFIFYQLFNEFLLMGYFSVISLSALALSLRQKQLIAIIGLAGGYIAPLLTLWMAGTAPNELLFIGYYLVITVAALALSLRQGQQITVLGLIGGYAAPFLTLLLWWTFSATSPNYFLLMGYISVISFTATAMIKAARITWLPLSIAVPHLLWMFIIIEVIPTESLFSWLAIYLSLTLYLIFAVPRMGWALHIRYRHSQKLWNNPPIATSLAIVTLMFFAAAKMLPINLLQSIYLYALLAVLIWIPAWRKGWSLRSFLPSIPVAAVAILGLSGFLYTTHVDSSPSSILTLLAIGIVFIGLRTVFQALNGDRSQLTAILLLALVPSMTLLALFFIHRELSLYYVWGWVAFTTLVAGYYIFLGRGLNILAHQCSAVVHVIIAGTLFILASNTWLTVAISLQIAVMALQTQYRLFPPASWVLKAAMGILVARLTLLPLIPEWQISAHWEWGVCYMLSLLILTYARAALHRCASELVYWFEGAILHVFLLALFIQTNYWLTGHYSYPTETDIDFTSAVIFANQALVMGLVYSYRSQLTQKLANVYQAYSYLLWSVFALLSFLLNTNESPLIVDNVSATAIPVFNMLTLGWLLPAIILMVAVRLKWNILEIPHNVIAGIGMALGGIWLAMSIRQFWQPYSMTLNSPTETAELFSYSIAGLIVGSLLTWRGVVKDTPLIQRIGLITLVCVSLKVFLWDARSLDGFWRAAGFLGLGASLSALGWLFQKFNRSEPENSQIEAGQQGEIE